MHIALDARKTKILCAVMSDLTHSYDSREVRTRVGKRLLDLFDAEYFASFIWNPDERIFEDRVALNMDPDNLAAYETYFQFRDPITSKLQQRKRATSVNEIIDQGAFMKTEFFNDFLARDGLHYGMNFYAYDGPRNVGDFRIWRGRNSENFTRTDLQLLNAIGPAFTNAQKNILALKAQQRAQNNSANDATSSLRQYGLTPRETTIALGILDGKSDKAIAMSEGVAFSTVRTHVQNLFQKLQVHNRTELAARLSYGLRRAH